MDAIHFIWEDHYTRKWEYGYEQAKRYFDQYGNLNVPATYINENGFQLGRWLDRHRTTDAARGKPKIIVTPERKEKLDALGFVWEPVDSFEKRVALCKAYFKQNGDLDISQNYIADGIWLGKWLYEQRRIYRGEVKNKVLSPEQIRQLEAVGIDWRTSNERACDNQYDQARKYFYAHGNLKIPFDGTEYDLKTLRLWLARQRTAYRKGSLTEDQAAKLANIGVLFEERRIVKEKL